MSEEQPITALTKSMMNAVRIFQDADVPPKMQMILGLKALGAWSNAEIASALGYKDDSAVRHVFERYDPSHHLQDADAKQRLVLISMMRQVQFKSLIEIAKKEDEFGELSLLEHAKLISMTGKAIKDIGPTNLIKINPDEAAILGRLIGPQSTDIPGETTDEGEAE